MPIKLINKLKIPNGCLAVIGSTVIAGSDTPYLFSAITRNWYVFPTIRFRALHC